MNGKVCIRGMCVTLSLVLSPVSKRMNKAEILNEYPYLEAEDIDQCLNYAALLAQNSLFSI
jgi:uncharacterized protein (DUF433 family)